jgi:hypothetical protein
MTPTPNPQQKEPFEKEYMVILDYSMLQTILGTLKSLGSPDLARHIDACSRPLPSHTNAPAPDCRVCCEVCSPAKCLTANKLRRDHDATIAKAARENTIEEIWVHIHPFCDPMTEDYETLDKAIGWRDALIWVMK